MSRHNSNSNLTVVLLAAAGYGLWVLSHNQEALMWAGGVVALLAAIHITQKKLQWKKASAVVEQHQKELSIRRRQFTVTTGYGIVNVSKWDADVAMFMAEVVFPAAGQMAPSSRNYIKTVELISDVTSHFHNLRSDYSDAMDPVAYENMVADRLTDLGWQTRVTKRSGDQGVDVVAEMRGVKVVIQCKLYSTAVGNYAVQEAYGGKAFEGAAHAAVVSNAAYTPAARALASTTHVFLLHHDQLEDLEFKIFGTSEWKLLPPILNSLFGASFSPAATSFNRSASTGNAKVLRDAMLVIAGTVCVVLVVVNYEKIGHPDPIDAKVTSLIPVAAADTAPPQRLKSSRRHIPVSVTDASVTDTSGSAQDTPRVARDDLSPARDVDSSAADHISAFCQQDNVRAEGLCRANELRAWRRLVIGHEFPGVPDSVFEKCRRPPFPDSFIAQEACTKYELEIN